MIILNEQTRTDMLNKITKELDKNNISYSFRGNRNKDIVVSRNNLEKASELSRKVCPELSKMMPTDKNYIAISSRM